MAAKSISGVLRHCRTAGGDARSPSFVSSVARFSSSSSSGSSRREDGFGVEVDDSVESEVDLRSRIFRLRFPKRSATAVVDRWAEQGGKVSVQELRQITTELRRAQRYKHALEVCEWMINNQKNESTDCDYAVRIELISKVFGTGAAEEFFEGMPPTAKSSETYTALLHSFAARKLIEKAECLFEKMKKSNISFNVLVFNEMMTLYISVGQLDKVSSIIEEMKSRDIHPDLFTYNLWVSACAAAMDIDNVKSILNEMTQDKNSNTSWTTYMKLANLYINVGQPSNMKNSPFDLGERISQRNWITYDFLIFLHASLGNKNTVKEIWKSLQMTSQKMTRRNYICVLSSFLVLHQFKEVEDIIDQWKQSKSSSFDLSACNSLSNALLQADYKFIVEEFEQILQKHCKLDDCISTESQ